MHRLKEILELKGMTQKELADKVDVTEVSITTCPINDCNENGDGPAPCCRECPLNDKCPDRCQNMKGCRHEQT